MKLLVLDVEGTLFESGVSLPGTTLTSTVWQDVASLLGSQAIKEELETHRKWVEGDYRSYLDWMKATVEIHMRHGLTEEQFDRVILEARYNDGVLDFFAGLDRARFEPVLVSGGFRALALRAQRDFRINHAFTACDYIFADDGALVGANLLPCDFEGKIDFIQLMLREYRLEPDAWVFVGDGANDRSIAEGAPLAIGINPHPLLREVVHHSVTSFREIPDLLSPLSKSG